MKSKGTDRAAMPGFPRPDDSPGSFVVSAFPLLVSAIIVSAAVCFCIFRPFGTKEYRTQALLFYSGSPFTQSGLLPLLPDQAASALLPASRYDRLAQQFGLYPQLRTEAARGAQLRSRVLLEPMDEYTLRVAFHDGDSARCLAVTNAVASLLANAPPETAAAAPASAAPDVRLPPAEGQAAQPSAMGAAKPFATQRRIAAIDARLQDLMKNDAELQLQLGETEKKVAAGQHASVPESSGTATAIVPLEERLAAARKRLAALRERYTDIYPDVEDAREDIAGLEQRIAGLRTSQSPATASMANRDRGAMAELLSQRATLTQGLSANEAQIVDLGRERDRLAAERLPGDATRHPPATQAEMPLAPAPIAAPALSEVSPSTEGSFHILQRATRTDITRTYPASYFVWIALAALALLACCLVPIVPADAPVSTESNPMEKRDGEPDVRSARAHARR